MKRWSMNVLTALFAATLVLAAGCGGDDPAGLDIVYTTDDGVADVIAVDDAVDAIVRDESGKDLNIGNHLYEIILLHDLSTPETVRVNTRFPIMAKVIDYGMNENAEGMLLKAEITSINDYESGNPASGDAVIETPQVMTGADGVGKIGFAGGTTESVIYEVTVSMPDYPTVAAKTIRIRVFDIPCGCLRTTIAYEGALSTLKDIEVYILPEEYRCNSLSATRPVPPEAVIASRTASSMHSEITFDCLPGEKRYTVFAKAGGTSSTCVAATGCYEGMYIAPDECQDLELDLYSTVMNPAGAYDSIDHFDFSEMIEMCAGGNTSIIGCVTGGTDVGKTVCCAIQEMIKFFETPGTTITEAVRDIISLWVGSAIVNTVYNLIGGFISDWITQWLTTSSPDWLLNFFGAGQAMMGTFTHLELVSDLLIAKLNNDFTVQGTHYWYGMNLFWKWGCDPAAPDYADCGKIELHLDDYILDPNFPMNFLEGKFTAKVADFDWLYLDRHEIKFNYGKLVIYVINQIVIPGLTGGQAHSMMDLVLMWINCKTFSEGFFGQLLQWATNKTPAELELSCQGTIRSVFGFVETFINNLNLDSTLSLTGDARMIDDDCDLLVDSIINGVYTGYIQGDTSNALVTGDFKATRK